MANDLILGIDVGTTSVKAGLIDVEGQVVASFSGNHPTRRGEGGRAEQSPHDWMRLVNAAIDRFVSSGYASRIAALGLCSQVNTHVFVGEDGVPLYPAVLWQDRRSSEHAAALDARISVSRKTSWWGAPMPIDASNVLSRMVWMADTQPSIWARTRWVMLPKDYCLFSLTGNVTTDPISNIGLVGPDLAFVEQVFDLVPGSRERVAPLAGITTPIGYVKPDRKLAGVPVVSGTMDGWAGIVGAGGAREGASVYLSGTSEIMGITSRTVKPAPGAIVFPETEGLRIHAAPTQSGGDAKLWFTALSGLTPEEMSERVADTPRSGSIPLFLPQLEGERAPIWDSDLRAAFLGLSRRSGLGDMARAVYEGVAFSARHALELLQVSAATVSPFVACAGGGFRSRPWTQIRADILGVECHMLASKQPGVQGAAMIAGIGAGHFENLTVAQASMCRYDEVVIPDPAAHEVYDKLFGAYKNAIETMNGVTKSLKGIEAFRREISNNRNQMDVYDQTS